MRSITPLPGRGCPQFANWGREWNAGNNPRCGTCKDLLKLFVLLSLFLLTISNIPARIPLPTRLRRATFSPGEGSSGAAAPQQPTKKNDHFPEPFPLFTFSRIWCIVIPEQSRKPRVKCHRDGELPGGRRKFFAMRPPHPLLHMGIPPLCSNDTRSGKGSAVYLRHFPPVIHAFHSPVGLFRRGFLFAWTGSGSVPLPTDKGGHFLWQEFKNPCAFIPIPSP